MSELPNSHEAEGSSSAANENSNDVQGESTNVPEISPISRALGMLGANALYYGALIPSVAVGNAIDRMRSRVTSMRAGYSITAGDIEAHRRERQPIDNPFLQEI